MNKNVIRKQTNNPRIVALMAVGFLTAIPIRYVLADSWNGNRVDKALVKTNYDPSVASYGYTGMFDTAIGQWNGISTKVSISKTSTLTSAVDRYYVGVSNTTGLLGLTRVFITNASGAVVETTDTDASLWHHTTVSAYDNQMNGYVLTTAERVNTIAHEIGHTLKLSHVGSGTYHVKALPSGSRSIMEGGTIGSFGPQQYDKDELRYKWGT